MDPNTRRIFILSDGKRRLEQVFQLCNVTKEEGEDMVKLLVEEGYLMLNDIATSSNPSNFNSGQRLSPNAEYIEFLTRELARFVGPIAPTLVNLTPLSKKRITGAQLKGILQALSENIENKENRNHFIAATKDRVP